MRVIRLPNGREIGPGQPCFIVAEAGVNHNGDIATARQLVGVAAQAGADAVKFQTFDADRLVTVNAPKAAYQLQATGAEETQRDMLRRLELSVSAHRELMTCCGEKGILFLSTPFDEESADLLESLGVEAFKIPSGEITNLSFLAHVARKGRPMIISTGMATLEEVRAAVETVRGAEIVLLHCVSSYPAEPADANLRAMETLRREFDVPVGFSDHTSGIEVSLASVVLGACMVEKHFTMDRSLPGPDHRASLEPAELTTLVQGIRNVESALGHGRKEPAASEANTAAVARKSLVAARDIEAGTRLTAELLDCKRPGTGLSPALRDSVVGHTARVDIPAGQLIAWEMLI